MGSRIKYAFDFFYLPLKSNREQNTPNSSKVYQFVILACRSYFISITEIVSITSACDFGSNLSCIFKLLPIFKLFIPKFLQYGVS